jgi:tetratricopeptide (TPR) repeat protein
MLRYLNPLTYVKWVGQFIYAWGMSLPWSLAPLTIPALILIVIVSVATVIAFSDNSNTWRANLLKSQLMTALDTDDFKTAELLLARQVQERPKDGDLGFRLAMIQSELGKKEQAIAQMQRLIQTKRHKEAARWIVREKFDKRQWRDLSEDERAEFGSLTKLMFEEFPKDPTVKNLYADYLIASGNLTKALPILDDLSIENPLRGLQAAAVARRLGLDERANAIAERSLNTMSTISDEDPTNLAVSLAVAQNQLFLNKHRDAIQTLNKAIKLSKTPEEQQMARQAFGDAMVALVKHIEDTTSGSVQDRLRIMEHMKIALEFAPQNPRVLTVISNQILATLNDDNEQIAAIRQALLKGVSPGVAHFIKGTSALMKGDNEVATRELKLANEHMPLSSAVMNNLAVVLLQNPDVDLEQPLRIVEEAIRLGENAPPHYYETRAQVLLRMERYEEAIPDLERALEIPSLTAKAHLDLATCYEKISQPDLELAAAHRKAAEELQAESATAQAAQRNQPAATETPAADPQPATDATPASEPDAENAEENQPEDASNDT